MIDTKQYYFANSIWQSKFNPKQVRQFANLDFNSKIILYYDFPFSCLKISLKQKQDKILAIAAINCCLRLYEKIKQIYPYNDIYVCIYTKNNGLNSQLDAKTFKTIIDLIPDFALITDEDLEDLSQLLDKNYRHIFYGNCSNIKKRISKNYQCWSTFNGRLNVN